MELSLLFIWCIILQLFIVLYSV